MFEDGENVPMSAAMLCSAVYHSCNNTKKVGMLGKEKYKIRHKPASFCLFFLLSSLVKCFEPHTCIVIEGFGALQKCICYCYRACQLDCP